MATEEQKVALAKAISAAMVVDIHQSPVMQKAIDEVKGSGSDPTMAIRTRTLAAPARAGQRITQVYD